MASDTSEVNVKLKRDHLTVAAIDFGITFTGFAFSSSNDPTKIYTSKWEGEDIRMATEKAPNCVLLSPDKEFVAFGYEAEERYKTLKLDDMASGDTNANAHYYFEWFKMKLYHTKKLRLDTTITEVHGKELPAIDVFAVVINHLKDKVNGLLRVACAGLQEDDVLWVITVPAIWSESAKQFMRKAASLAGLEASNVKLILEPEAASLHCINETLCNIAKLDGSFNVEEFPEGMKYIVADLGGSTANLSIHEILPDGILKEIHRADGEALGSILINQAYSEFLEDVFGSNFMLYLRENYPDAAMAIQLAFETKKRAFKFDTPGNTTINLSIPCAELREALRELKEDSIKTKVIRASTRLGFESVKMVSSRLFIGKEIMEKFFAKTIDGIVDFINRMREHDELGEINTLLMVGGLSESKYVQQIVKQNIPGVL